MIDDIIRQCGCNNQKDTEDGRTSSDMTLDDHLMVFGQTDTDEWYQVIRKIIEEG